MSKTLGFLCFFAAGVLITLAIIAKEPSIVQYIILEQETKPVEIQKIEPVIETAPIPVKQTSYIDITKGSFDPSDLIIPKGTNVTFRNKWSVHVVNIYRFESKYIPITQSKKLKEGDEFSVTLTKPGEYFVRDIYFGWKANILVEP